jgi:hypothetical protein
MIAGSGFGWVYEDNCNARLMPALSKQSDSTIKAQRDVRIIRPEHDTDATVSVRELRSALLRICFSYGRESTRKRAVALARDCAQNSSSHRSAAYPYVLIPQNRHSTRPLRMARQASSRSFCCGMLSFLALVRRDSGPELQLLVIEAEHLFEDVRIL